MIVFCLPWWVLCWGKQHSLFDDIRKLEAHILSMQNDKPWEDWWIYCFDLKILIIILKYWLGHLGPHKIVFSCMQNQKRYREVDSVQNVKWLYSRVWIINKNWQSCTWDCNLNIFFWIQYLCDWLWTKTPLTNYLICTNHLVYNPR